MRRSALLVALFLLAGCAGGSGTGTPVPAPTASPAATDSRTASVTAVIVIGSKSANSTTRHASYVPTGTMSASVSVNGGATQTFNATGPTIGVTINNLNAGANTFDIAVWTGLNGTGNMLARAITPTTLNPGGNTLNVTLNAIVNSISVTAPNPAYGTLTAQTIGVTLSDAASNVIPGGTTLYAPVTVTSSDPTNSPVTNGASFSTAGTTVTVTPATDCAGPATITAMGGGGVATGSGTLGSNRHQITSTADTSTAGTLRYLLANAVSGDIIYSTTTQTINVTTANLPTPVGGYSVCSVPTTTLTVTAPSNNYTFFNVPAGATASFENLLLENGGNQSGSSVGGAIQTGTSANVTVKAVQFMFDQSSYGAGAINGAGTLSISNSSFASNASYTAGAISWGSGTATISNTTFSGNSATSGNGGAIYDGGAMITCTLCTFMTNNATGNGGAIDNYGSAGVVTLDQCYFASNYTGAGVGGAIAAENSTTTNINNSTFFTNSAYSNGGAIGTASSYPNITISYSTFSGNTTSMGQAGNLQNDGAANYQLVANVIQAGTPHDLFGSFGGSGYDIISDISGASGLVSSGPGIENFNQSQPLGAPALNGGTTDSMSIGTGGGNPAYNAVPTAKCTVAFSVFPATTTDQRGTVRPHLGTNCSAGAYEP